MITINIRGEEMNLSEARLYVNKLKKGEIKTTLTEQEKEGYALFERITRETNASAERSGLFRYFHEKEYLIGAIEAHIAVKEHFYKIRNN